MYLITEEKLQTTIQDFTSMEISGNERQAGDDFFATHGPGNTVERANKPFERFHDYEELLSSLQIADPAKYKSIHKGTPFYFLAWTALDMRNYEKALFYMDAAISEDIINHEAPWIACVAGSFVTLKLDSQSAPRVGQEMKEAVAKQLHSFNASSGRPELNLDKFVDGFVKILVGDPRKRSIVTSFYTFILEFEDRVREIQIRSKGGGSIEPFLTHLFKGGLIFESLLKHLYPYKDDGKIVKTLGDIFRTNRFIADFFPGVKTSATSLEEIVAEIDDTSLKSAFDTTSQIRNTTGHNLVWNDVFSGTSDYKALFSQQMKAILYLISIKFF